MNKQNLKNNKGFTLIEMLVTMSLFAIVVTITMGAIVTIIDVDKKARSLTLIIDNTNFALETLTRDIKTSNPSYGVSVDDDSIELENSAGEIIKYAFLEIDNKKILAKSIFNDGDTSNDGIPVIAQGINLGDNSRFEVVGLNTGSMPDQPLVRIILDGEVNLSEKTKTDFNIQTSVSVRELNLFGYDYD